MKAPAVAFAILLAAGLVWLLAAPLHGGVRHGPAIWLGLGGAALLAGVCAVVRARRRAAGRRTGVIAVIPVPRAYGGSLTPSDELRKG
ncbi:hypothetical protein Amsp01_050530 [Amycolatopsis sp. NBRC 101858]|uniref:hypothetical protein n=1 Tax=Amycolatopsis sp. NBRC 101858 TaxID=3032200 RepID=UPI00249FF8B3|nr:hypothetical protein [Amycolatopsis sp. NBRC 101858]GLY39029.1 hypothetical protein Amsp01_050530 [Amycolatopsis sp. NBRC 101858]